MTFKIKEYAMRNTLLTFVVAMFALGAWADEWIDPETGIAWTYTVSGGEASVGGGNYNLPAVPRATRGSIVIPSELGGYSVKNIDDYAFCDCSALTSVTIPEGVTRIGAYAFSDSGRMTSVIIPPSVTSIGDGAFSGCSGLTNVTIPASVTSIDYVTFSGCSGLNSMTIPSNVTSIGEGAFSGCSGLKTVMIPPSVTNIGFLAFEDCGGLSSMTIPDRCCEYTIFGFDDSEAPLHVTILAVDGKIGDYAFYCNRGLSSVTISNGVTSIGDRAFETCAGLKEVTIPGSVTNIGEYAFEGCGGLTSVIISEGVEKIEYAAFCRCSGLETVIIPSSMTSIEGRAFSDCTGLTSVTILPGVTSIGAAAFSGCIGLKEVTIPEGVTSIGNSAFLDCSGIESVMIPSSVRNIDCGAFANCKSIGSATVPGWKCEINFPSVTNLVISDGTTYIRNSAFSYCSGLKRVSIPSSVTSVGDKAFYGCDDIADVTVPGWKCGINFASVTNLVVSEGTKCIDDSAFSSSKNLLSVTIPEGVMSIGDSAFEGCDKLTSVTLPDSLESIGRLAFHGCEKLTFITLPNDESQLGQRIGCPECSFRCFGETEWSEDDAVFHSTSHSVTSGDPGVAEAYEKRSTTFSTILCGKGDGSFWWKVDCEPKATDINEWYDYTMFSIDGVEKAKIAGKTDWEKVEYAIPDSGIHMLRWTFVRDDYDEDESLYENKMWIDDLSYCQKSVAIEFDGNGATRGDLPDEILGLPGDRIILPMADSLKKGTMMLVGWSDGDRVYAIGSEYTIPLGGSVLVAEWVEYWTIDRILNAGNVIFSTGGASEWTWDFNMAHDGTVSFRSGVISDSQSCWAQADFTGKGEFSFWTKSAGEFYRGTMRDFLAVTLDGVEIFRGATNDWTNIVVSVNKTGDHTIKWTYSKNENRSSADDCAWVDEVCWMPEADEHNSIPDIGDNPTAQEVAGALAGSADAKLAECITNAATYNAYRAWAESVKGSSGEGLAGAQAVKESPNAWVSFALGSEKLLESAPTDEDLTVEAFEPSGEAGQFDFTVSVKDVAVGSGAQSEAEVERVKENLKQVFGLEGASSLDAGAFSSGNVDLTFGTPEDGKVKFTAGPKDATQSTFFMKVRVK